ncbi:hypothetical protein [Thermogemmatispora carboxidivorans]|uniref:hypothetical protein n=1 Tax=Thermogemmatispora carboxidivorans TaxID=1382306 RepID=UPI00069A8925|nr:hypothetical protein [Thermogemmatispora carboxidivorans]
MMSRQEGEAFRDIPSGHYAGEPQPAGSGGGPELHPVGEPSKVYPPRAEQVNLFRFLVVLMAMVTILVLAVICLVIVGGAMPWLSFGAGSFTVFLVTVVALDKIK